MINRLKKGLDVLGIGELNDDALDRCLQFMDELLRWNKKINLTAITTTEDMLEKHLLDSLILIPLLQDHSKIIDIGSGAGFPVIPLTITMPEKCFCSVDSVGKKINFQQHIKRTLQLKNLDIYCERLGNSGLHKPEWSNVDIVLARAVTCLEDLLKMALPLLRTGGMLIAMKGPEIEQELREIDGTCQYYYDLPFQINRYQLPFTGARRSLVIAVKKT